ncbi:hypothetical protein CEXT_102631 [Caerostris extrusa]|uniref:Uncharacterized protein n=1 Tax=Caerostris extrusa TaxID=172846 RepID=A0AAV4TV87_CAEEX|nr:hypothetical protein CEXT_102631 [Caerostris extrusa]
MLSGAFLRRIQSPSTLRTYPRHISSFAKGGNDLAVTAIKLALSGNQLPQSEIFSQFPPSRKTCFYLLRFNRRSTSFVWLIIKSSSQRNLLNIAKSHYEQTRAPLV